MVTGESVLLCLDVVKHILTADYIIEGIVMTIHTTYCMYRHTICARPHSVTRHNNLDALGFVISLCLFYINSTTVLYICFSQCIPILSTLKC